MTRPAETVSAAKAAKIADAEARSASWLAKGNEYRERGYNTRAEGCYAKATYWLDRANKLRGNF